MYCQFRVSRAENTFVMVVEVVVVEVVMVVVVAVAARHLRLDREAEPVGVRAEGEPVVGAVRGGVRGLQ